VLHSKNMNTDSTKRCRYDLTKAGLREVPELSFGRYGYVLEPTLPHRHDGCLEIGIILRGALTLLSNGREYRIMPGGLFLNKPKDLHCLTTTPKGTVAYNLLLRPPQQGQPFLRLTPTEARDIWKRLNSLPCHIAGKTDAVKDAFAKMFEYHAQDAGPYRTVRLTSTCLSLLIGVIEASVRKNNIQNSPHVAQIIAAIREHPEETFTLDTLAQKAHLSPSLLTAQFKQLTGLPPHHYQLACRLEKAQHLLSATDQPITEIAFALGFCASQHFSAHFKRSFGITPNAWRKQARDKG